MKKVQLFSTFLPSIVFVCMIWIVFWIDNTYTLNMYKYGLMPRKFTGLIGIITMPFIHGDLRHLFNNSVPLIVLISFLFHFFKQHFFKVFIWLWILNGLWTWVLARESFHIGASGLVYAFSSFIFFSGIILHDKKHIALSLLIVFLYGSMIWGIFPIDKHISWEAHLTGFISGIVIAFYLKSELLEHYRKIPTFDDEDEDEDESDDISSDLSNPIYNSNSSWQQKI